MAHMLRCTTHLYKKLHWGPQHTDRASIPQNHVFYGGRQAWDLPWDVGLPAPPCLTQVLQNGASLQKEWVNVYVCCRRGGGGGVQVRWIGKKAVLKIEDSVR
jgi:hypothetical protein